MKVRLISAAIFIPILLLLLMVAPTIVTAIVWGLLLAIAVYELLYCTGLVRSRKLVIYSAVMALAVTIWSHYGSIHAFGMLGLMVFIAVLFGELMRSHVKVTFDMICLCVVAGFVIPLLLSSLIRILIMSRIGRYMVLIPFIVAFGSDAGAYFAGRFFGQHKLAPVISQHKTIEGVIGGMVSAVVLMLIYGIILQFAFEFRINYGYVIIYALLGSVVGVFGDLCFSVIKRQTGIKDYGNLIPGHGGVLDRFDSMMMVGPLMEALLILIPMAV